MNDNFILAFTIILSFIGIIISVSSLIFAIIYLIKISKLDKNIKKIDEIKEILILQLTLYSDKDIFTGYEALNFIKQKCNCDDLTAIKIIYELNQKNN